MERIVKPQYVVMLAALAGACKVDHGALPHEESCEKIEGSPAPSGTLTYLLSKQQTSTTTTHLGYVAEPGAIDITAEQIEVRLREPVQVGRYALADLDAYACEETSTCTKLEGTLDVDEYDPSCVAPQDSCTRLSARLVIDPPADVPDGPSVFGSITITDVRTRETETCDVPARAPSVGCDCRGGMPGPE